MRFFILFLMALGQQTFAGDLTFTQYHTQDEINDYLAKEASLHPNFVQTKLLGYSLQKRKIYYSIITDGTPSEKPAIYFNGTHHGDEWSSTESILALMDQLITRHDDADIAKLLHSYTIYIQPLVNPDGHFAHTREDSQGRDPNRDYAFPGKKADDAFQLPEIQLVKHLIDTVHFRAAAAYHSGIEEVLWSWCYTADPTKDAATLGQITQATAKAMDMDRYMQSYFDYETQGEFIDYAYMTAGTLALTFEVSEDKTPDVAQLPAVVERSVDGALAFIAAVQMHDQTSSMDRFNSSLMFVPPHYGSHPPTREQSRLE